VVLITYVAKILGVGVLIAVLGGCWNDRLRLNRGTQDPPVSDHPAPASEADVTTVRLSAPARKNLSLTSKRVQLTTFWRTLELPGLVVDRPGISDRGVVTPITGVVTKVHAFPGSVIQPGDELFSIRLISDSLQTSQLEIFKATKEIEIAKKRAQWLAKLAQSGTVAQSQIVELESQIERLEVIVEAYRQDLQARGLPAERIEAAASGQFATELIVRAPDMATHAADNSTVASDGQAPLPSAPVHFEMQSLEVELGQQVNVGDLLCYLADHRRLLIEGRGFTDDLPWLQDAAKHGRAIEVEFNETGPSDWPSRDEPLRIEHVANVIDPASRTFAFYLGLTNQSHTYTLACEPRLAWRYRPGMRVRLQIPVEKFENVYVIPRDGVTMEPPNAYVFRQNGDLFDRREIHVLHEDRRHVVVANDGTLRPGFYVAQNAAAALSRVLKTQGSSGVPAGFHVHADGTVHGAH
jgi:membrane fusion protein, heavy metal efflux system